MTYRFIVDNIDKKINENDEFIRFSYYELKIKNNLSEDEIDIFLKKGRDYLENKGYKVYFTNARYEFNGASQNVQANELMIAFK